MIEQLESNTYTRDRINKMDYLLFDKVPLEAQTKFDGLNILSRFRSAILNIQYSQLRVRSLKESYKKIPLFFSL